MHVCNTHSFHWANVNYAKYDFIWIDLVFQADSFSFKPRRTLKKHSLYNYEGNNPNSNVAFK
jgi:hypothetical protein